MALGREDYNGQQYEEAAAAFAKVGRGEPGALEPDVLEAGFYRGLSLLFSGDYRKAEEAFGSVARVLPLAEVVNNEGVAVSRQGRDGIAFFSQAEASDPNAADYHFNLAVSLKREGKAADALAELTQCLRLRPMTMRGPGSAGGLEESERGNRPGADSWIRMESRNSRPIRWSALRATSTQLPSARRRLCWTRWMPRGWPRSRR
jgi:tetratricopeptide (TPR) repeat protein